jgi:glycosyltransferase involved in cell wall biosynthesis
MPVISVIVPVYNAEEVLHYCIDSIINQTYKEFELILVDDGSKDNSGKICDEYAEKDSRIKVVHKQNEGVSVARNTGITRATGKYICFVDSDDYLDEDYLEELIIAEEKYPDCDNIWCGFKTVQDYNGSVTQKVVSGEDGDISFYTVKDIMTLHAQWLDAMPWNKLFIRDIIIKNNIEFPKDLSLGEDLIFNLKYLNYSDKKIVIVNKMLYNYIRTEKESLDNKYYPDLLGIYEYLDEEMFKYAKEWNLSKEQITKIYNSSFFRYELVLKNTFHSKNDWTNKQRIKFNNSVLRSSKFKNAVSLSDCYIHPFYKLAYKSGFYKIVQAVDILVNLKK